jgi:tape measure domain-containing protein
MANDLRVRVDVAADVTGTAEVDRLAGSVDRLGDESRQTGAEARAAGAGIDNLGGASQRAAAQALPANRAISASIAEIGSQINSLSTSLLAIAGGTALISTAAEVGQVADAMTGLRARIQLVVGEGPALESALVGVQAVALSTGSALADVGRLFTKIADAGKALSLSQADSLAITETISQSIALSGETADASAAAIQQLIQALQSGVLRGEEFNSIMEQAPRLARALADGLGVSTGALRAQAEAGALTTEIVIGALQGQAAAIGREFAQLPLTIGTAMSQLKTNFAVFVAEVDASTGASTKAASAIQLVGENLDFIVDGLMNAGQAWLAWKAYNIVAEFLGLRAAVLASATATGIATAATAANTAATAANTAAQVGNNAARAGSAAGVLDLAAVFGKLGTALSFLKFGGLIFLLANLKDIGEWIGKVAYGFTDLAKRTAEQEKESERLEKATKKLKLETDELANKKRLAAEAALGLTIRTKGLVATFEETVTKGGKATEAIQTLAKALDLSDVKGITDAGAAIDALALKGKLSADQVREVWRQALSGKDLKVFTVEAGLAFDGTEQGARRLAAAIDASLSEAVRRTGKDVAELSTGISAGAQAAITNYDFLAVRIEDLKAKGLDVGLTLAASLEQATQAATTEGALQAVIKRWEELGEQGLVAGDRLRKGLDGARDKLDGLLPGINSVAEAFRTLGLKSQADLQKTADTARQAYDIIRNSGTATAAQLQEAFKRAAAANIEANGGLVTDAMRVEAAMRGLTIEVDSTGKAIVTSMSGGTRETQRFGEAVERSRGQVRGLREEADRPIRPPSYQGNIDGTIDRRGGGFTGTLSLNPKDPELTVEELKGMNKTAREIEDYYGNRRLSQSDQAAGLVSRNVSNQSIDYEQIARDQGFTGQAVKTFVAAFSDLLPEEMAALKTKLRNVSVLSTEGYLTEYSGAFERAKQRAAEEARRSAARDVQTQQVVSTHRVEIVLGGKTVAVDTASPDSAQSLIDALKSLQGRAS